MEEKTLKPAIRFKGFEENWVEERIEDIANLTKGRGYSKKDLKNNGTPIVLYGRLYTKYETNIKNVDTFVEEMPDSIYSTGNEVIIPSSGETPEDIARASAVIEPRIILGGDLNIVKPYKNISSSFLANTITFGSAQQELAQKAQGKSVVHLHNSDIKKTKVKYPTSLPEQTQIGAYFEQLDQLLIKKQEKLEKLKQLKKAMLSKMFPKKGALTPEIRFKGFTQNWVEKKLGEVGSTLSGVGFPECEQGRTKGIPFFKISDMNTPLNTTVMNKSNNYVTHEQISKYGWKVIKNVPAIIFAKVGAAIMLNRKRLVKSHFLIDNNTMAYIFSNLWDCYFGKSIFETIYLPSFVQTGALPSYSGKDIENITILFPTLAEQEKIGNYFQQLDLLIESQDLEIEKLKNLKKGFLDKMFV